MSIFVLPEGPVGVRIAGTGHFLPDEVHDNAALIADGLPTTEHDIVKKSGIHRRHIAAADQATSDLAIVAGQRALAAAGCAAGDIDRLLLSTTSPDQPVPSTASFVHAGLGLRPNVPGHDVAAACAGSLYALDAAARYALTGRERVLVIGADIRSRVLDASDVSTRPLFADGAGALVVEGTAGPGALRATATFLDSRGRDKIGIPGGGSRRPLTDEGIAQGEHFLRMHDGLDVYMSATEGMAEAAQRVLDAAGLRIDQLDLLVPHQASGRILRRLGAMLDLDEGVMFDCIADMGNTSSGAVLIALDRALRSGRTKTGDVVLLLAAGAGYTCAAALLRIDEELITAARGAQP